MFELAAAHFEQARREREIEAALRRRLLLDALKSEAAARELGPPRTTEPDHVAARLRAAAR